MPLTPYTLSDWDMKILYQSRKKNPVSNISVSQIDISKYTCGEIYATFLKIKCHLHPEIQKYYVN